MSDDDAFNEIVNNQPEDDDSDAELTNIWEGLTHIWPHFYPGYLVKGVVLAEYVNSEGERLMRFITSPDVTPWELLGLIESARLDAQRISVASSVDEDEEEDG